MDQLLLYALQIDEMLIKSRWDGLLISIQTWYGNTSCYWNYWKNIVRP